MQWLIHLHQDLPATASLQALRPSAHLITPKLAGIDWPRCEPGPLVGYGPMRTMTLLRRQPLLGHAVFDDYPALRFSSYAPAVRTQLGRVTCFAHLGQLGELPLERWFGPRVFVRSDSNFKLFPAELIDSGAGAAHAACWPAHADELVVLSAPLELISEYRSFCRRGAFVCGSSYPELPYRPVPAEVRGFAEGVAQAMRSKGVDPLTVDVGVTRSGALHLVELGGVNSWGLYGADPEAFVAMMEAEALARHAEGFAPANVAGPTAAPSGRPDEQRRPSQQEG
jgi:hypothetical protein